MKIDRAPLRTRRLALLPATPDLASNVWQATGSSLRELRRWMPFAMTTSAERTKRFLAETEMLWDQGMAYHFIASRGDRVVGMGAVEILVPSIPTGELAYWIRTKETGKGLATEMVSRLVEFAFGPLNLHRLDLRAGVGNPASNAVARKLGFVHEGTLRESEWGADGPYDAHIWGLLRREWENGRQPLTTPGDVASLPHRERNRDAEDSGVRRTQGSVDRSLVGREGRDGPLPQGPVQDSVGADRPPGGA